MQHRGVKVVHGDNILDRVVAEVVGVAVADPTPDTATSQPE